MQLPATRTQCYVINTLAGGVKARVQPSAGSPPPAHNVTPDEVEQVLYARPRLVLKGAEGTEYAFGTTDQGRYLMIVLAESIDGRA